MTSDEVISYDINSNNFVLLLSEEDGLTGPEGMSFDSLNNILYVSSRTNNQIIAYDLTSNVVNPIECHKWKWNIAKTIWFNQQ